MMENRYQTPVRQGRRQRNPFVELNRDNFPGWDRALESDGKGRTAPQYYEELLDLDRSACSQASSSVHTSAMDMSIGARAAMNEHLRYIAVHGLDGHGQQSTPHFLSRLPEDEVWDRLMDGDKVSVTSSSQWDRRSAASSSRWERLEPVMSTTRDGTEAVEVSADLSDYFNSSKVWQLSTPEKNKGTRRAITTRGGNEHDHYEEDFNSGSEHSEGSGMMYLYNAALGMHKNLDNSEETSSSFVSLEVDLSRISGSDISDIRTSPDESFQQGMENCFGDDFVTRTYVTPSRLKLLKSSPAEGPIFKPGNPGPKKANALNFSDIALSPIAAQAGSIAVKLGRPSRRNYPCALFPDMDELSPGLALKMSGLRVDEPSPISHANQSGFDLRSVGENCILDMSSCVEERGSMNETPPGLKPRRTMARIKHGSHSSTNCAKTSSCGIDRRRYRTVVPARVFMNEPNDFPYHDDSFSVRSQTVATSSSSSDSSGASRACLPSRSLLHSFDDVYEF